MKSKPLVLQLIKEIVLDVSAGTSFNEAVEFALFEQNRLRADIVSFEFNEKQIRILRGMKISEINTQFDLQSEKQ